MSDPWDDIQEVINEPFPRFVLEIPIAGRTWLLEHEGTPATPLQALMEAPPGVDPVRSTAEKQDDMMPFIETFEKVLADALTDEERAVAECMLVAGHSTRTTADILGMPKSTVHRLYHSTLNIIRRELKNYEHYRPLAD